METVATVLVRIYREEATRVRYEHLCEAIQSRSDEIVRQEVAAYPFRARPDRNGAVCFSNVWFFMLLACIDLKYSHSSNLARMEKTSRLNG